MTRAEEIAQTIVTENPMRPNLLRRKIAAALEEEREWCAKIVLRSPTAQIAAARIREGK